MAQTIEAPVRVEKPDVGVWGAVVQLLENAFIRALEPGLEGGVDQQRAKEQK